MSDTPIVDFLRLYHEEYELLYQAKSRLKHANHEGLTEFEKEVLQDQIIEQQTLCDDMWRQFCDMCHDGPRDEVDNILRTIE